MPAAASTAAVSSPAVVPRAGRSDSPVVGLPMDAGPAAESEQGQQQQQQQQGGVQWPAEAR